MERLNIFIAVFDRNTVAKADRFHLVCLKPFRSFRVHEKSLVLFGVRILCKRIQLIVGINDDDITFAYLGSGTVQICSRNMGVRRYAVMEIHINGTADKGRKRYSGYIRPVVIVMIRALRVCSEMCHDIDICMEIRDRAAGIEAEQFASSSLGRRIYKLGEINKSHSISQIINSLHVLFLHLHMHSSKRCSDSNLYDNLFNCHRISGSTPRLMRVFGRYNDQIAFLQINFSREFRLFVKYEIIFRLLLYN